MKDKNRENMDTWRCIVDSLPKMTLKELFDKNEYGNYYFTSTNRLNSYFKFADRKVSAYMILNDGTSKETKFNNFEHYEVRWDNWVIIPKQLIPLWENLIHKDYIEYIRFINNINNPKHRFKTLRKLFRHKWRIN